MHRIHKIDPWTRRCRRCGLFMWLICEMGMQPCPRMPQDNPGPAPNDTEKAE